VYTSFLVFIAFVLVSTLAFAVVLWRQLIKIEKKALAAKQQKEEYIQQLLEEKRLEEQNQAAVVQENDIPASNSEQKNEDK